MKRISTLLIIAATVLFCACNKNEEKLPTVQFELNNAFLNVGADLELKIVLSKAADKELSISYTVGGTAVKDADYTIEKSAFTVSAGESEATITLKHINQTTESKTLNITLSPVAGYDLGNKKTCIIAVGGREDIVWSFLHSSATLQQGGETEVEIKLIGQVSGNSFKAPAQISIPFEVKSTSTASATDYSIKNNATAFVVPTGGNTAKIVIVAGDFEAADPAKFIELTLKPTETGFEEGDRTSIKITLTPFAGISDIVGTWTYDSFILTDDPDNIDSFLLEMLTDPDMGGSGDDLSLLPKNNTSSDKFTISAEGDGYKLTPSMTGDIGNYFRTATISGATPDTYTFYYYTPGVVGPFDATKCTLSSVNKKFSAKSEELGEADFRFYLTPDRNKLYVFIDDYIPTDFLNLMYAYDDGSIYEMYPYLWDMGYTFTRVTE